VPDDVDRESYERWAKSAVRSRCGGGPSRAVSFHAVRAERAWTSVTHRLAVVASVFGEILARQRHDEEVRAGASAKRLDQLQIENVPAQGNARAARPDARGRAEPGHDSRPRADRAGRGDDATVLLLNETGTGKELFATEIHERGRGRGGRWCA
jgi:transcriptional regulator with PAS, ATPase and Fis domain